MHTNHTTNYELSQFVSSDKPTFLGDYNGDMQKIDTAIAGVGVTASGADSKADSAIASATAAASTASDAATLANTANTNANSALATAGNAATAASAAQSTADSAATAANTADGKAVAAQTAVGDLTQLTTTDKTDLVSAINEVNAKPAGASSAAQVTYDNTTSGLTATDVQAAIDELKALIPAQPEYVTTGLSVFNNRAIINSGGYYVENGICHVDITITAEYTDASSSADYRCIDGFPEANITGDADVTAVFNQCVIVHASNGDTRLNVRGAITAGTTLHFIGSYQIKTL